MPENPIILIIIIEINDIYTIKITFVIDQTDIIYYSIIKNKVSIYGRWVRWGYNDYDI